METDLSRRRFLTTSGALGGVAWLKLAGPTLAAITASACTARESASSFESFSEAEAAEITAIAARLIPTTDTPGATEAGVIHFIDKAFTRVGPWGPLDEFRVGLADFETAVAAAHRRQSFSALPADAQDAFLATQEGSGFFELFRQMTIVGFFAMSSYGGNRDHVGWQLIDFPGHGAWTPPFGYYDQEAADHAG
ncbi:MAG: gluconate 2-dehydrogenase subunit 3 family protein [Pseudomonadales bacterium]